VPAIGYWLPPLPGLPCGSAAKYDSFLEQDGQPIPLAEFCLIYCALRSSRTGNIPSVVIYVIAQLSLALTVLAK